MHPEVKTAEQKAPDGAAATAPVTDSTTGTTHNPGYYPIGSPAWEREHTEWVRRDEELRQKLQGVCRNC